MSESELPVKGDTKDGCDFCKMYRSTTGFLLSTESPAPPRTVFSPFPAPACSSNMPDLSPLPVVQTRRQITNPYYFMFASLAKPDGDAELHWLKVLRAQGW
ncbi:hypothetical protein EDD15DRAFT_2198556 [Pisolithus albus]|nr:hypothetical protein EDD15DRAFT_2198556 [Pisolithus albus]